MLLSSFKPVSCRIPPVAGANDSLSKVSDVTMMNRQAQPPLQAKGKEKSLLQESPSAKSRREMLHLTAASVGLLSLVFPSSAEAGTRNATMRRKIREKFEELRRKSGLSKPQDEGEEKKPKDEAEGKSKVQSGTKEAKPKPKDESEAKPKVHHGGKETKAEIKDETEQPRTSKESKHEGAMIPALPGIINDKPIETTLP
ncbi:microtubule-associated protein 1B-like [Salvia splendens]|uniref:microtubule-associated protein 1B-like n=1 Tax=Salvia splendens TaxID=180675 RepID=UPI0011028B7B|nr:microtubule-associated protein 1B-like [Salvia splendens]